MLALISRLPYTYVLYKKCEHKLIEKIGGEDFVII